MTNPRNDKIKYDYFVPLLEEVNEQLKQFEFIKGTALYNLKYIIETNQSEYYEKFRDVYLRNNLIVMLARSNVLINTGVNNILFSNYFPDDKILKFKVSD